MTSRRFLIDLADGDGDRDRHGPDAHGSAELDARSRRAAQYAAARELPADRHRYRDRRGERRRSPRRRRLSSFSLPFSLEQQYQFKGLGYFTAGGTAYVLTSTANNSFGNPYYLLSPSGGLYAYDGSGSYAHTFANVTPLATLGSDFYTRSDAAAQCPAAVNYTTVYNLQQQYQFQGVGYFTAGATAYVLHSNQSGPSFGRLLPADGERQPVRLRRLGQLRPHLSPTRNLVATLDPSVYVNPSLLLNAKAAPACTRSSIRSSSNSTCRSSRAASTPACAATRPSGCTARFPTPTARTGTRWFSRPTARKRCSTPTTAAATPSRRARNRWPSFDSSVYSNPSLLLNAKAPVAATGVTASVTGGTLTLNAPASFVGTFQVTRDGHGWQPDDDARPSRSRRRTRRRCRTLIPAQTASRSRHARCR